MVTSYLSDSRSYDNGYLGYSAEGRILFGRSWRMLEDNIKIDLEEEGWEDLDWIHLAQDRDRRPSLLNTAMNIRVP
jgi:hypothetical protein